MSKIVVSKEKSLLYTSCPKCREEIEIDVHDLLAKLLLMAFLIAEREKEKEHKK